MKVLRLVMDMSICRQYRWGGGGFELGYEKQHYLCSYLVLSYPFLPGQYVSLIDT